LTHPNIIGSASDCALCAQVEEIKAMLRRRSPKDDDSPGCALCKWILLDLEKNGGKLKGWNLDSFNKPVFPKEGEIAHLKLEEIPFVESAL
jgi:hypothetical protein